MEARTFGINDLAAKISSLDRGFIFREKFVYFSKAKSLKESKGNEEPIFIHYIGKE